MRCAIALTAFLWAQTLTPAEALQRLLSASKPKAEWFAESFLREVPMAQIEGLLRSFARSYGRFQGVHGQRNPYWVEYEKALLPAYVRLDKQGRFVGLLFRPAQGKFASWEAVRDTLQKRPEVISVLVMRDKQVLLAMQPDTPLAVGSTFKVAVLAALLDQIQAGKRHWDEVVPLDSAWKSLPSGRLQDWPPGAPLTLYTLAALMISESDNTATDALIQLVGRPAIEAYTARNRPFLTTQEFFKLLFAPHARVYKERWPKASLAERQAFLDSLAGIPLRGFYDTEAVSSEIEAADLQATWVFSLRELDTLMRRVERLPLMGIEPGLAWPEEWRSVAYKGGSYPGVLNMTTVVYTQKGERYFIGMTWNHLGGIEEAAFRAIYGGLLRLAVEGQ